ncbi:hypothetical protein NQ318_019975 [Aromia moschata]|uniref:DUF4817 domain-containing protein n=1 Tax=Aromia moschata TaxID=1265417 RepID=A0AAV8Y7E0_9CUCU|nr:hypothetical protein NQ318_019975 [Aromia moschata]
MECSLTGMLHRRPVRMVKASHQQLTVLGPFCSSAAPIHQPPLAMSIKHAWPRNHCCQITMASYTTEQHVQMIKLYYQNECSLHSVRQRNARSIENIAAVRVSVQENPRQYIPRRAQELGLSQTSTWRILHRDLGLHPYKIQLTQ